MILHLRNFYSSKISSYTIYNYIHVANGHAVPWKSSTGTSIRLHIHSCTYYGHTCLLVTLDTYAYRVLFVSSERCRCWTAADWHLPPPDVEAPARVPPSFSDLSVPREESGHHPYHRRVVYRCGWVW